MTSPKWKRFDTCSAPLCPLDEKSLKYGIWYPDEEICSLRAFGNLPWIKTQKKIVKVGARVDRYFNLKMLERNCIIKKGIEGLDPDHEEEHQLRKWIKAHPEKRKLTEEEKERLARMGQKLAEIRKQKFESVTQI